MKNVTMLLLIFLSAFGLSGMLPVLPTCNPAMEDSRPMKTDEHGYGKLNPNAPPELSRWEFLLGRWRCDASLKQADGTWQSLKAAWEGRAILDGYVIADEFRMTTPAGDAMVLGLNLRSYDSKKKAWTMKWLNATAGTWTDLGLQEQGGVQISEKGITYILKEPLGAHLFTRATYTNISANHFTWRGEKSDNGKSWEEFLVIEATRVND